MVRRQGQTSSPRMTSTLSTMLGAHLILIYPTQQMPVIKPIWMSMYFKRVIISSMALRLLAPVQTLRELARALTRSKS